MARTKIKTLLLGTLIFTFLLLFTFGLKNELNYNNTKSNVISKIDKSFTENLKNDKNIFHVKFAGMFEAQFDDKVTKINIIQN